MSHPRQRRWDRIWPERGTSRANLLPGVSHSQWWNWSWIENESKKQTAPQKDGPTANRKLFRLFNKKETGPRSKGVPVTPETYPPTLSQSAKLCPAGTGRSCWFRLDLVAERSVAEEKPQCLCHHLVWGSDMAQSLCHCYGETIHWRKQRPPSCGLCQGILTLLSPDAENSTFHKIMTNISQDHLFFSWFSSCLDVCCWLEPSLSRHTHKHHIIAYIPLFPYNSRWNPHKSPMTWLVLDHHISIFLGYIPFVAVFGG